MNYQHSQVVYNNILFDSEMECDFYKNLLERENRGEISDIRVHPEYVLIPPFIYQGNKINAVVYTPDFDYKENGATQVIEVKGLPTRDFELRLKMWKYLNQDKPIRIMAFSKSTGWMELSDYKKARKQITKQQAIDRAFKKDRLEKEKKANKLAKLIDRMNVLNAKPKLTKVERERLEEIKNILKIEEVSNAKCR